MDEDKLVERVARAICVAYGDDYDEQPADLETLREQRKREGGQVRSGDPGLPTQADWEDCARAAWDAAKAALAEATRDILRNIEAAARVAEHETLAAPNAPGWPATCAVLRHLKELREVFDAAPDQR